MNSSTNEQIPKRTETTTGQGQVKILLVDDLEANLLALEGLLRRDDVEIFKAKSGTEALEFMIPHEFALAFIDVKMPGMSGFELAEFMRGAKKTKNIPIIFVTATSKEQNSLFKGYESGAVDFLPKPLDAHAVKSKTNIFIELFRHKKEQEALLVKLKQTQIELETALQIRDEFMSIASHELNTPLAAMKIHAQLMRKLIKKGDESAYSKEKVEAFTGQTERQVIRLERMVNDMLDIARIRSGKLTLEQERFDLCEMVGELVQQMHSQFLAAGYVDPKVVFCETAKGVWDRMRIEQVLINLLTNAIKYGERKPVAISVECFENQVKISVKDQGIGISPEAQEKIFNRFERAKTTKASGLGLGLFIAREIVSAHKGKIWVESELGKGATFFVELPTGNSLENQAKGM